MSVILFFLSKLILERNLMTQPDFSKMFSCPRCGTMGAIYFLKVAGNNMIIKQRCPIHGGRSYKVPLVQKDISIPYIRDAVYKCYKCGQEVSVDQIKASGPWTLIRGACPNHGNKLPFQKIWNSVYAEISSKAVMTPQPEPAQPIQGPYSFLCFEVAHIFNVLKCPGQGHDCG